MILSSADILRKLGSDAIVRQCARLSIVDGKPGFGTDEYVYIYIDRYPEVLEFEATWKIWILDGGSDLADLVLTSISSLLPGFQKEGSYYTTTDFATSRTVVKSEASIQLEKLEVERRAIQENFKGLSEAVEGQLKSVRDGIDGQDGIGLQGAQGERGERGYAGQDGRDLVATEADLGDLQDVEMGLAMQKGQVLTWDGVKWTNLFIPQLLSISSGGGGSRSEGENVITSDTAPETREDGSPLQDGDLWWESDTGVMYLWYVDEDSAQWVQTGDSGGSGGGQLNSDTIVSEDEPTERLYGNGQLRVGDSWFRPFDSTFYVYNQGAWNLVSGSGGTGTPCSGILDGGNADDGTSEGVTCGGEGGGGVTSIIAGSGISVDQSTGDVTITATTTTGGGGGIGEAPLDGNYYVRADGQWLNLVSVLNTLGYVKESDTVLDAGDFS